VSSTANANPATPAVATPASATTSSKPKRKRSRVPRQSKSIWKKIPYRSEYQGKPIFRALLSEMLTWPKSYFQKDSKFIQADMPMSHFICARLIIEAAQGDLGSAREIIDRIEGKPWQKLETESTEHKQIEIGLMYEAPISEQARYRFEAAQQLISLLPVEMQAKARAALIKPEKQFVREPPKHMKQLPEPDNRIEYIETPAGSAE
jgi:hypothetical protein